MVNAESVGDKPLQKKSKTNSAARLLGVSVIDLFKKAEIGLQGGC